MAVIDLSELTNYNKEARSLLVAAFFALEASAKNNQILLNQIEEFLGKASDTLPPGPGCCE